MLDLLIGIDRRTKYLDRAFPAPPERPHGPLLLVEWPAEEIFEPYKALRVHSSVLPNLEKIYGEESRARGESPVVTMCRYAATAGSAPSQPGYESVSNAALCSAIEKEEARLGPKETARVIAEFRRDFARGRY